MAADKLVPFWVGRLAAILNLQNQHKFVWEENSDKALLSFLEF